MHDTTKPFSILLHFHPAHGVRHRRCMFLLGVASLIQLILLPGFLLVRSLKVKTASAIQSLLFFMGLSLYSNYLAVCLLTWLTLYTPPVVTGLVVLELSLLVFLALRTSWHLPHLPVPQELHRRFSDFTASLPPAHRAAFLAACFILLVAFCLIPISAGSAYYFSDALMHWTRWPAAWAANTFPIETSHYPQLFPADLSVMHLFTGDPGLQFFPKTVMPLFFIGILLMFFDLFIDRRSVVHLAGFFVYAAFLFIFYSLLFILEVNADIPVSFFAFLTYYTVHRRAADSSRRTTAVLVCVFAVSAANTKLAGLYMLLPAAVWTARMLLVPQGTVRRTELIRTLIAVFAVCAAGFFWYAIRPSEMIGGLNQSVYLPATYSARLFNAVSMLYHTAGAPLFVFLCVTIAAALWTSQARSIVLVIVAPSLLLWAFFFSADFRNLSYAIPFAACSAAYGLKFIYGKLVVWTAAPARSPLSLPVTPVSPLLLVLLLAVGAIAAGTSACFNAGMNLAYFFHALLFRGYRIGYMTELGYYRYVEYYCSALRLACVAAIALMGMKYVRLNTMALILAAVAVTVLSGAAVLTSGHMHRTQTEDMDMVTVRNLYYRVYPYLHAHQSAVIVSNNARFCTLILPAHTIAVFRNPPDAGTIPIGSADIEAVFLLIDKRTPGALRPEGPPHDDVRHTYAQCFDDDDFLFLRVYDRMEASHARTIAGF
jgi:hypothetical protein